MKHVSTSYVERQNLTMRMHMRRFTRLTNAHSKKIENHACAVALHAVLYNFVRINQAIRVTPAMAAGITDRVWEMTDLVEMIEASNNAARPRGLHSAFHRSSHSSVFSASLPETVRGVS
jgi:hypothetical protein